MDALGRVVKHRPVLFDTPPVRATFFLSALWGVLCGWPVSVVWFRSGAV